MTEDIKLNHCSFCGTGKEQVEKLIVGDNVAICSTCVELCQELIVDETAEVASIPVSEYDPETIKAHLDQHVIGQDDAKVDMISSDNCWASDSTINTAASVPATTRSI